MLKIDPRIAMVFEPGFVVAEQPVNPLDDGESNLVGT